MGHFGRVTPTVCRQRGEAWASGWASLCRRGSCGGVSGRGPLGVVDDRSAFQRYAVHGNYYCSTGRVSGSPENKSSVSATNAKSR